MGSRPTVGLVAAPVLRTTTAGRRARSARLLVGSTPSMSKNVNRCSLCFLNLLARRALSGSVNWRPSLINSSSLFSSSLRRRANASGVSSSHSSLSLSASRSTARSSRGNLTAPQVFSRASLEASAACGQSTFALATRRAPWRHRRWSNRSQAPHGTSSPEPPPPPHATAARR